MTRFRYTLNRRERIILFMTLGVVGVFVFDRFLLTAVFDQWSELNRQISKKEKLLKRDLILLSQREKIEKDFQSYALTDTSISDEQEEMTFFLNEIESQARRSGVRIKDIKPSLKQKDEEKGDLSVRLTTESSWRGCAKFLMHIQKSPLMLVVESSSLHNKGERSSQVVAQFEIKQVQTKRLVN